LSGSLEVIIRKRDPAEMKLGVGPLMHNIGPVHDDVPRQDCQATVQKRWRVGLGDKANRFATRLDRDSADLWERCMKPMHQEPIQADLRHFGVKSSFLGGK
jgi:hypothetical protein